MKGSPLLNNNITASSVSSGLIYTESCWPNTVEQWKIQTRQKITFLSHDSTHGDTTECASLSESHCITRSPLLKIEEIQPRPKIGQKFFQQSADHKGANCTSDDIFYCFTSEIQLRYKNKQLQALNGQSRSIWVFE